MSNIISAQSIAVNRVNAGNCFFVSDEGNRYDMHLDMSYAPIGKGGRLVRQYIWTYTKNGVAVEAEFETLKSIKAAIADEINGAQEPTECELIGNKKKGTKCNKDVETVIEIDGEMKAVCKRHLKLHTAA